jgi:hypothetical protein
MPVPVLVRRALYEREDRGDANEIWICECCGEDWEEALAVYVVIRVTRSCTTDRSVLLCASCADRIPHGKVLSS